MGKRALLNVGLAAALLALVWVVWQEPGHAPKPAAVKLTALAPAAIANIVISGNNGPVTLAKKYGQWWLQEPLKAPANPVRVENLLQVAEAESLSRFPAAGRDLAQFGLDKPTLRLRLNDTELSFGGVTPVGRQRYVLLGDTIHLINDNYLFGESADAAAYISRDLLPKDKDIAAIDLPVAKLTRGDKGEWTMTPADKGVSQDAIRNVADAWREAQALRVAPYDRRPEQGAVAIRFTGGQSPLRYGIIAREPELILARPDLGMQYYLAADQAARLLTVAKPAVPAIPKQ